MTLRLDYEIVDHFRAGGPGWQTRLNAALREVVQLRQQQRRAPNAELTDAEMVREGYHEPVTPETLKAKGSSQSPGF